MRVAPPAPGSFDAAFGFDRPACSRPGRLPPPDRGSWRDAPVAYDASRLGSSPLDSYRSAAKSVRWSGDAAVIAEVRNGGKVGDLSFRLASDVGRIAPTSTGAPLWLTWRTIT